MSTQQQVHEAVAYLRSFIGSSCRNALILGSGLGGFTERVDVRKVIPYREIPGFPESTVKGHSGDLVHCNINDRELIVFRGRFHFYEGHPMESVVIPVRVMGLLGIKNLFLTNASGGVNPDHQVGDLMVIDDHINLLGWNPLTGINNDEWGPRFPDMSSPYDRDLTERALSIGLNKGYRIHKGVYAGLSGPCYETRAEYRYVRTIGADSVGMSTVPEVIAARHMGIRCAAISVITDLGGMEQVEELSHDDVLRVAGEAGEKVADILTELIRWANNTNA
jgi:purine-nucleoside phosphorylase